MSWVHFTEAVVERGAGNTTWSRDCVGRPCAHVGRESERESNPERAEGAEDYAWEGVAQNPLANGTQNHQDTTESDIDTESRRSIWRHTSESHEVHGKWCEGQQEADKGAARC